MTASQRRIAVTVTVGVFSAALVVVLLGGCSASGSDDDGCDWFALAAAPAGTKAPRKDSAPSMRKEPPRAPAARPAATSAPTSTSSRKPGRHPGIDIDICD